MKKTYSKPSIEVIAMKPAKMMMMSNLGSTDATSGNLSRDMYFDFDEE